MGRNLFVLLALNWGIGIGVFLRDSEDLAYLGPVAHTVFYCEPACQVVDLRRPPFTQDAPVWTASDCYLQTQEIARVARKTDVQAIIYQSVRDENPAWCVAILSPVVFEGTKPKIDERAWFLSVTQNSVQLRSQQESYSYKFNESN